MALLAVLIAACGGGGGGGSSSSAVTSENYEIPAGETRYVTGNMEINVVGRVKIDGQLLPQGNLGQNITIKAGGDIAISGTVRAGNGASGSGGGALTITSTGGSLSITGTIGAGDGGNGVSAKAAGGAEAREAAIGQGAGADGGNVTLSAPKGSVTLSGAAGQIHIGNGGNGAAMTVTGSASYSATNRGGNSGMAIFDSPTINGIQSYGTTVPVNSTPAPAGYPQPGDKVIVVTSTDLFSGGEGGNGGAVTYGSGSSADAKLQSEKTLGLGDTKSSDASSDTITVSGAKGGEGGKKGGNGGAVTAIGRNGSSDGEDGQDASASGGQGGTGGASFYYLFLQNFGINKNSTGGTGGKAISTGGKGAPGSPPSGGGGKGGSAQAIGGSGGNNWSSFAELQMNTGVGGEAIATGGNGGKGGGQCPDNVGSKGGRGGKGGDANAQGGNFNELPPKGDNGKATATGGSGGEGGDGAIDGNSGGDPGAASAEGSSSSTATRGLPGASGSNCGRVLLVTPATATKIVGETQQFNATFGGINVTSHPLNDWTILNTAVATIDLNGLATCVSQGVATIKDRYFFDGSTYEKTATLTCNAVVPPSLSEIPGTYALAGTKTADTCGNGANTISNPGVQFTTSGNSVYILSSLVITGLYDALNGSYSGTGTSGTLTETIFDGQFKKFLAENRQVLEAFLEFYYADRLCKQTYNVTYTKK